MVYHQWSVIYISKVQQTNITWCHNPFCPFHFPTFSHLYIPILISYNTNKYQIIWNPYPKLYPITYLNVTSFIYFLFIHILFIFSLSLTYSQLSTFQLISIICIFIIYFSNKCDKDFCPKKKYLHDIKFN